MLGEVCCNHLPEVRLAACGSLPKLKQALHCLLLTACSRHHRVIVGSKPAEMNLAGDCTDASPCSVHPFLQFSSPFLLVSTLPSSLPISDEHQQLWNGPAPPPHLSLSHCAPSSAPAPAPGTLSCPMVAVPWFSSLHLPLQFLCLIHCTISSVPTTAVAPRTYRSITTVVLGPTNPEGNHSLLLTGTRVMLPHHLPPAGQWFGDRGKRCLRCPPWPPTQHLGALQTQPWLRNPRSG